MRLSRAGRIEGLENVSPSDVKGFNCESCILGKGKRLPAPPSEEHARQPLTLVHIDIWGPASTASIGGCRYILTCYDDNTRKVHLTFLKNKSDAFTGLKDYISKVERQLGCTVKGIRSDNRGEFVSTAFKTYMLANGIEHVCVPPGAHAQNGRVERVHLTVLDGVRTVLAHSGLPAKFWAEAANYIAYTRNRTPCGPQHLVPDDMWWGKHSRLDHLQPFGCQAYFRNHTQISKLQCRYKRGVLLGYVEGTHNYRIWDTDNQRLVVSRDVVFTTDQPTSTATASDLGPTSIVIMETDDKTTDDPGDRQQSPRQLLRRLAEIDNRGRQQTRTPERQTEDEDTSDDELLLRPLAEGGIDPRNFVAHAQLTTSSAPQSYRQARHSGEWEQWEPAMQEELAKMEKYNVWDVVPRTPNMRVVGAKWVYTRKIDGETGKPSAYKARWVAKGYSQIEGLDFNELFAAVAHKDSIRVFLSLVNHLNLECDQVDIKAAFLNGDLEETIYLDPPEGSDIPADKVLHLRKSLYGLKQSPRCFNKAFDTWLQSQHFAPASADPCLYTRRQGGNLIMLSVHVDDQLIASNDRTALDKFKKELNDRFECSDSGEANYFLGFNIHRNREAGKLYISQEHYLEALLDRFDLSTCNPARNPLPYNFRPLIATDEEFEAAKHLPYPQVVGSILYASTVTRPDLSQAAGVLSRFISKWSNAHWLAAKHVLRYIRGTSDLCLTFTRESGKRIALGYANADWGGDLDTRRSTTGYVFKVYGGVVAWKSRRQPTVALSTTEAEYMASADATRQAIWLRHLLDDLQLGLGAEPLPIFNDNAGTIALAKNPVNHERTKHIGIRHHFLREKVEDNTITLSHVSSAENIADLLTKSLPQETFVKLRQLLGVTSRPSQVGVSEYHRIT